MPNTNCLEGLRCPQCGNEDRLRVVIEAWADMTDDGTVADGDDHEFTAESRACCPECGFGADGWVTMEDFRMKEAN